MPMTERTWQQKLHEARVRRETDDNCDRSHGMPASNELTQDQLIKLTMECLKQAIDYENWEYVFDCYALLEILNPPIAEEDEAG